jgi:hypothetical protein
MLRVDGVGGSSFARRSWLEMSLWKTGKDRKKEKEHTRKKRDRIRTAELNRRDQVTATGPGPVSFERGNEVDYQVAAPNESSTPKLHRAKIAQQRVRMEGWRQERLGSRAGTHREKEKNKNILTGKEKKKNILALTGLLMEGPGRYSGRMDSGGCHKRNCCALVEM